MSARHEGERCERRLDRRTFLRQAGGFAGAVLMGLGVAPVAAAAMTLEVRALDGTPSTSAARVWQYPLPTADGALIDADNEVLLVRWAGRVYAFSLSCPHRGGTIRWEGTGAFCPKHKARFSPDGANVGGRQTRALDRFAIRRLGTSVAVDTTAPLEQVTDAAAWAAAWSRSYSASAAPGTRAAGPPAARGACLKPTGPANDAGGTQPHPQSVAFAPPSDVRCTRSRARPINPRDTAERWPCCPKGECSRSRPSGISKWLYRQMSQEVCPWNVRFARELKVAEFAPREALAGKDARILARELLSMSEADFSAAFKSSPMKRAKLRGHKRNAAVVLGNISNLEDVDVLTRALDDPEPLVRGHAAWALEEIESTR
jgi:nitrite reductase/ring-hydroxylating ferredoxin subunit